MVKRREEPKPPSPEAQLADRLEASLGRGEERLRELGFLPPNRTRAQRRERAAGRRAPNDGRRGQTAEQIKAARRAKAKATRKGKRR